MPHEPSTIVITGPPEPILVLVENPAPEVAAESGSQDSCTIVIEGSSEPVLVLVENPDPVVSTEIAVQGPPGPPGPKGDSGTQEITVNGFEIQIDAAAEGDVLSFSGSHWGNRRQETLTDGGNF